MLILEDKYFIEKVCYFDLQGNSKTVKVTYQDDKQLIKRGIYYFTNILMFYGKIETNK